MAIQRSNDLIVTNGDMSTLIQSSPLLLLQSGYAIQAIWTSSSIIGAMKLQFSCAFDTPLATEWSDYSGTDIAVTTDNDNFGYVDICPVFRWVRLVYTPTSGTGTLNVRYNIRDINVRLV